MFLCLRRGHLSRNCQTPVRCFKCQGSRHVSLCSKIERQKDPKQEEEKKAGVTPALNIFVGQSRESVLLQTATVNVVRPDNESYVQGCRLVFDSCSQRTYTVLSRNKLTLRLRFGRGSVVVGLRFGCGWVEVRLRSTTGNRN